MRQVVLDTETTGLSPKEGHRIIEIGCLEMVDRQLTGESWHHYINPERLIEEGAFSVHGISNDFLKDKPLFKELADDLLAFIEGAELIIHNAPFDLKFLNHEFNLVNKRYKKVEKLCEVFDTLPFARRKHPGQKNSLDALCKRYSVNNSNRELHGALLDSELLAQVYLFMTGGQTSLFADDSLEQAGSMQQQNKRAVSQDREPLPVMNAAKEELEKHDAMMALIKETSGKHPEGWE